MARCMRFRGVAQELCRSDDTMTLSPMNVG
jgi:hypothetical protein